MGSQLAEGVGIEKLIVDRFGAEMNFVAIFFIVTQEIDDHLRRLISAFGVEGESGIGYCVCFVLDRGEDKLREHGECSEDIAFAGGVRAEYGGDFQYAVFIDSRHEVFLKVCRGSGFERECHRFFYRAEVRDGKV